MHRCHRPAVVCLHWTVLGAVWLVVLGIFATRDAASFVPEGMPQLHDSPPAAGMFLVASTDIRDPRFHRSVILLVKHDNEATLGLIVNRPTRISLDKVFPGLDPEQGAAHVYFGGPVHPTLFSVLVRTDTARDDRAYVLDDVYTMFGVQDIGDALGDLQASDAARVYSGYAGWSPGQLESEIRRGGWHVLPAEPSLIFSMDPETVWEDLIERVSGRWI